jgi:hypothetical protein
MIEYSSKSVKIRQAFINVNILNDLIAGDGLELVITTRARFGEVEAVHDHHFAYHIKR